MSEPCPHCQSRLRQAKWGRTACGSQKSRCPACHKVYVAEPKAHGLPAPVRQQAVRMSLDGINQRRTARLLGVSPQSVANWLKAYHEQLAAQSPDPPRPERAETVELDELYTFVGSKKGASTSARP